LLALKAMEQADKLGGIVSEINQGRQYLQETLPKLANVRKVYPSDANFVLVEVTNADKIYTYLLDKGIVVRNRTNQPGCFNCLRVTVGTQAENRRLVQALEAYTD